MAAGSALHIEANVGALDIGTGELGCLQALYFFLARSGLGGAGAGGKARDEFIELRDFLFALGIFGFDAGADVRLGDDHVVVAADVHDDRFVVDVGGVGADAVEEMAVVRDDNQDAFVFAKIILEPVDGIEVEVVGGLVEEQGAGIAEEGLRQQDANFLAALQLAHFALLQRAFYAEAVEQNTGVRFGGVAAFFADDAFEFAEAHAVGVGEFVVGLGVEGIAPASHEGAGHILKEDAGAEAHGDVID